MHVSLRQAGRTVDLELNNRGAATVAASLTATTIVDEDSEMDFEIFGSLQVKYPAP